MPNELATENNPLFNADADGRVPLSDADAQSAIKTIQDLSGGMSVLAYQIRNGLVMKSDVKTHLSLMRHAFNDLSKLLDDGKSLSDEVEEANALCRAANQRCRELEARLGSGISADAVGAGIQSLVSLFETWYETAGFHYASIEVNRYGLIHCDFSSEIEPDDSERHADRRARLNALDPRHAAVSEKVPYLFAKSDGVSFDIYDDGGRLELLDTDNNKWLLSTMFKTWFPNSRVTGYESHNDRGKYQLRIKVCVPLNDIENLTEDGEGKGHVD